MTSWLLPRYFPSSHTNRTTIRWSGCYLVIHVFLSPYNTFARRGCIIYVENSIRVHQIMVEAMEFVETVTVGISYGGKNNILIICTYRSSNAKDQEVLTDLNCIFQKFKICRIKYNHLIHIGDFNF